METERDAREAMVIRLDVDIAAPPQRVRQIMGTVEGMIPTLVTIRLGPHHGGTHVTLVHSGFEHLPEAIARAAYEGYRGGWTSDGDLERLKQLVEGAEVA